MSQYINLSDYPALSDFLTVHESATIAVPIDTNGTIHVANLLYWHNPGSLKFYFVTSRYSEKCKLLTDHKALKCAIVVGTEKDTPFTMQMRGSLQEIEPSENDDILDNYYRKRKNRHDDINNDSHCLLEFSPNWGRFTDYSKGYETHLLDLGG